jgi:glycosyltransferase involved in cell wall biosynthesis
MLVLNKFTHDTRVYKEARTLTKAGFDVTVWALGDGVLPAAERVGGFEVKRWTTRLPNLRFRIPGLTYSELVLQMTRRLWREKAQVYHAHDMNALLPSYLAARMNGAHLIYDSHEFWPSAQGRDWRARLRLEALKRIEGFIGRRAQGVITVNTTIAQELNKLYGVTPVVLMNYQKYVEVPKSDILRRELNIAAQDRIAIYAGIWVAGRGLERLIASVPYLDRVVVVLMGPDKLNGKLERLAQEFGVQDRVKFRSPVPPDQVSRYVASADIGLMPTQATKLSYYYGCGNKLFHYLMAGIPAAVSNHPEKRRVVETYDVGTIFDETNPKDIAQAINTVLDDEQRYQRMCRNARKATREELNWQIEEQKLLHLYRSLQQD